MMTERIDGDIFKWIVGGLLGLIASIGGFWLTNLTARLDTLSKDLYDRNQRISSLETHIEFTNKRLDRIEAKLDILIEKRGQ